MRGVRQQIMGALETLGPSTARVIAAYLHQNAFDGINSFCSRMTRASVQLPQQLHVSGWTDVMLLCDQKPLHRAIYALGPGENVPRPPADPNARKRVTQARYRKRAQQWRMSSPFNMGVSAHAARYSENRK